MRTNHFKKLITSIANERSAGHNAVNGPDAEDMRQNIASIVTDELPFFDRFPYLVTRIAPSIYHLILLPRFWNIVQLTDIAERQFAMNQMDTCLVLGANKCCYYSTKGKIFWSESIPAGGTIVLFPKK